jgi:ADP-ribose pyrophosphatase
VKVTGKRIAFESVHLRLVEKYVANSRGENRVWETIERKNVQGHGAVVIVGLTRDGNLIFEKNWRAPLESFVIQFPAGLTDIPGEDEEEAARRELLEETGYKAKKLIPVMLSPLAPALTATRAMHFFAPDVEFTEKMGSKDSEEIEVVKIPVEQVDDFLLNLPSNVELDLRVPGILWVLKKKGLI